MYFHAERGFTVMWQKIIKFPSQPNFCAFGVPFPQSMCDVTMETNMPRHACASWILTVQNVLTKLLALKHSQCVRKDIRALLHATRTVCANECNPHTQGIEVYL